MRMSLIITCDLSVCVMFYSHYLIKEENFRKDFNEHKMRVLIFYCYVEPCWLIRCHLFIVYTFLFTCLIFLSLLVASFILQLLNVFNTANYLMQFCYCSYTWSQKEAVVRVFPEL